MKVYLASPFFNEEQIERIEYIENLLEELGFEVFSPRKELVIKPDDTALKREVGFSNNCDGITNSDFVLAVTDGKDMGTIWESGYAYGKGIPVLYFAETLGDNAFNLMLAQSALLGVCKSRKELDAILTEIKNSDSLLFYMLHKKTFVYEGKIE